MSDDGQSAGQYRSGPLLPPDGGRDRPLFLVAAILVFLACLSALGARGAWQASQHWTSDLESSLTIQIRPVDGRDAEADAREAAQIALDLPGVARSLAHDRTHAEALLSPWLGQDNLPADLPLPLMVDVELEADAAVSLDDLRSALNEAGLPASVDDHGRWIDAVRSSARSAQTLAISLLALLTGAAAAVIAFAARASLVARQDVTDALHLCGAEDRFIADLFQKRFFLLGLKAGIAGAFVAALVSMLVSMGETPADMAFFLPRWSMDTIEIGLLIAAPILAGLVSAVSARLAVSADLRDRW